MLKILYKYHPTLKLHLNIIQKGLQTTFLLNKILEILNEIIRLKILSQVKLAGIFSVVIDMTTDVSNLEQLTFLLKYVNDKGGIEERLVVL